MSRLLVNCLGNLWTQRISFACMGFDIGDCHKVLQSPVRYFIMWLATAFELCTVCAFMALHRGQIVLFSEALMHGIQMVSSLLKMSIFLWHSRIMVQLMRDVQLPPQASPQEQQLWQVQNYRGQLLAAIYFLMCALTSVSFLLMPVVLTLWRYQRSGQFVPVSSFRVALPYDVTVPGIFLLDCCLMCFVLTFFCCSTTSVDTLYIWFVCAINSHYHILIERLQAAVAAPPQQPALHLELNLLQVFHYHGKLLQLLQRFDAAFRHIVFVEVLLICLLYCSVICQYIMPHTNQNFAFLGFFTLVVSSQLCIYGFGAEQVRIEAEHFSLQLYLLLPWHCLSPRLRRLLLLPLQRAQQETILSGYFFVLGRPLLVWIFRTAGSFTTLLNALRQKYE